VTPHLGCHVYVQVETVFSVRYALKPKRQDDDYDDDDDDDDNNNNNNNNAKIHDGVAEVIHQKLAETAELIEDTSSQYKYTTANVLENDNFTLYWNRSMITDKTKRLNLHPNTYIQMQKSVILGTCSIVRNFLHYK
jgi:hypothetical protein